MLPLVSGICFGKVGLKKILNHKALCSPNMFFLRGEYVFLLNFSTKQAESTKRRKRWIARSTTKVTESTKKGETPAAASAIRACA